MLNGLKRGYCRFPFQARTSFACITLFFLLLPLLFLFFLALMNDFSPLRPPGWAEEVCFRIFTWAERKCDSCPSIRITIEEEDYRHLQDLYRVLEGDGRRYYYKEYNGRNRWIKAKLSYQNKDYRINVKAHGKDPNFHRFDEFISLKVRFREKGPFGAKTIRFIVYERLGRNVDYVRHFSEKFGLITEKLELVNLQVNDHRSKLFFTEITAKNLGPNSMVSLGVNPFFIENERIRFNEEHESLGPNVKKTVRDIAGSILEEKLGESYLGADVDYLSSLEAARMLGSFSGHGFSARNFEAMLNEDNGHIYPILSRDDYFLQVGGLGGGLERWFTKVRQPSNEVMGEENLFLRWPLRLRKVRELKFRKAYEFLQSYGPFLQGLYESERKHYQLKGTLYRVFVFFQGVLGKRGHEIGPDLKSLEIYWEGLKRLLKENRYFYDHYEGVSAERREYGLKILPASMAPTRLNRIKLRMNGLQKSSSISVNLYLVEGGVRRFLHKFEKKVTMKGEESQMIIDLSDKKVLLFHPLEDGGHYLLETQSKAVSGIELELKNDLTQEVFGPQRI